MRIYKAPQYLFIQLKKLKKNYATNPTITYPVKELNLENFIVNSENLVDYEIKTHEIKK